jgi:hypothetical protein
MLKHLYHTPLLYFFSYSRKMQDNDMTNKKKKFQIKLLLDNTLSHTHNHSHKHTHTHTHTTHTNNLPNCIFGGCNAYWKKLYQISEFLLCLVCHSSLLLFRPFWHLYRCLRGLSRCLWHFLKSVTFSRNHNSIPNIHNSELTTSVVCRIWNCNPDSSYFVDI